MLLHSSLAVEYEEDYEDVTVNQMLAPKSQDSDTTEILNNLLKEYDKKLRPDIGGKAAACLASLWRKINRWPSERLKINKYINHAAVTNSGQVVPHPAVFTL